MNLTIVSFSGNYPLDVGGPQSVAYYLAKTLQEKGVNVSLWLRFPSMKKETEWSLTPEAKLLKEMGVNVKAIFANYSLLSFFRYPFYIAKVSKQADSESCELVHFNSPPVDAALSLPKKFASQGIPMTIAIHGGLFYESKNFLGRLLFKRQVKLFKAAVVFNSFSKEIALRNGFPEESVKVIPNAVDVKAIESLEAEALSGEPSVFFSGRLETIKGVQNLIQAVQIAREELKGLRVYVAGSGSLENLVKNAAEKLKPNLVYLGKLPTTTQVIKRIKGSSFYVLPSLKENFSISLLEAMASGVPIICSDAQGNTEVVNENEAWIFKRGSPTSLAETLILANCNEKQSKSKAKNAFIKVKTQFDWSVVSQKYYEFFEGLVQ
ncbi:hypothetical protein B9Q12_01570 [Candidatus Marsarchaeota G2 archaeon ECH_B_SAG-G06]|uniref:Glycosyl transferase family 1 domain-containing protein n=1 Tax=Candidatus Marsarchaeota G2 archaeon ECH_B_SAG-G06 TaxID=1978166 RepID=A0A2R6C224_9ARCH|nr:MAG: hypothetical protein B9Q12_01570 [Candidatus Marsarchaeota G2 archaeon ECH_B_SAG-G06]